MHSFDLVIVGGGPSGLAAAAYALHAQLNVALVTPDLGGKVHYPFALRDVPRRDTVWGAELVHQFEEMVNSLLRHHFPTDCSQVSRLADGRYQLQLGDGQSITTAALIIATGARPQRLYVPGEIEYWGRGVSFSAISHAPFFQNRDVAVIGAGERAVNAVLVLAPLAKTVYFIVANSQQLVASPAAQRALSLPNVAVFRDWEVQQVVADEFVTGLDLVGANGEIRTLDVEGIFVQFSLMPTNAMVRDLVELDEDGHIIINQRCQTSAPGIFAAGDVSTVHAEQVPVSLGEGAKAALSAWEYLAIWGNGGEVGK